MAKTVLKTEKIDHGICLIHVCREESDLNDSWDIVPRGTDGTFERKPNAFYRSAQDTEHMNFKPVHVTEHFCRYDENGFGKRRTEIRANGVIVAVRNY